MKIKSILFFTIAAFLFVVPAYYGRYTIFLLDSNSATVRESSHWAIRNVYGWSYQEKFGISDIDFLLGQYDDQNATERNVADFLMRVSCEYVERNDFDPSLSFLNALYTPNMEIVNFWLHRRIDLKALEVPLGFSEGKLTVDMSIKKISVDKNRHLELQLLKKYIRDPDMALPFEDPCAAK